MEETVLSGRVSRSRACRICSGVIAGGHPSRWPPLFHKRGMPVLAITYRNDVGAPASEDGKFHLGATEWEEVAATITHARSQGAPDVYLYGYSMGGAIIPMAARKLPRDLIFADTDDTGVPIGPALEVARARPDLVTLVQTSGGGTWGHGM